MTRRAEAGTPHDSPGESDNSPYTNGNPGSHDGALTSWPRARRTARSAAAPLPAVSRSLGTSLGHALARPLTALTDLPAFDTAAMDGWAVAGAGPWRLTGRLFAGQHAEPLREGAAVSIATGAQLPPGATAVLRQEHAERGTDTDTLHARKPPAPGQDVRRRGQECRVGDELLPVGTAVTPVVLGLAAAAGYDELSVHPRPTVEVLVLGDELLRSGTPRDGRVRDALGPLLAPWLSTLGADVLGTRRLGDEAERLRQAIETSSADLVITTGGTAAGPKDFVHPVLHRLGATLLVDGVAVRPGHPMLLAALPGGGRLVGLPGNPLAAVSGVVTLVAPLVDTLSGRLGREAYAVPLAGRVSGHPTDTRLVPVTLDDHRCAEPLRFHGPAMLRGLAAADGLAVIPPGGTGIETGAEILEIDW